MFESNDEPTASKADVLGQVELIAQTLWPKEWEITIRTALDDATFHGDWLLQIRKHRWRLRELVQDLLSQDAAGRQSYHFRIDHLADELRFHFGYLLVAHWVMCRKQFGTLPAHYTIPRGFLDDQETLLLWFLRWMPPAYAEIPRDWGHRVSCPEILQMPGGKPWHPIIVDHNE